MKYIHPTSRTTPPRRCGRGAARLSRRLNRTACWEHLIFVGPLADLPFVVIGKAPAGGPTRMKQGPRHGC